MSLTDEQMVRLNYDHYASLFPKTCSSCGRTFATLRDYILNTRPVGATISYDAELGEWKTTEPLGAAAMANCPCGSTMALTTAGIPLAIIHDMLEWIRIETERRGVTTEAILAWVRTEVRNIALAEQDPDRT